ncbi:hypothetical protein BC828DRAFT_199395 [Blastocladiella britannica]|nr:hypothetical protein BC828DRAFT_199395 [Blastocladiella britannica]
MDQVIASGTALNGAGIDLEMTLRNHPLFQHLHQPGVHAMLASLVTIRHISPGTVLIKAGEEGRALFLVLRGSVAVTSKDGEAVFATFGAGSFVGEIAMVMTGIRRTASVVSTERCVVAVLQRSDLMDKVAAKYGQQVEMRIREAALERMQSLHPSQRAYLEQQQHQQQASIDSLSLAATVVPPPRSPMVMHHSASSSSSSSSSSSTPARAHSGQDYPTVGPVQRGSSTYIEMTSNADPSAAAGSMSMSELVSMVNSPLAALAISAPISMGLRSPMTPLGQGSSRGTSLNVLATSPGEVGITRRTGNSSRSSMHTADSPISSGHGSTVWNDPSAAAYSTSPQSLDTPFYSGRDLTEKDAAPSPSYLSATSLSLKSSQSSLASMSESQSSASKSASSSSLQLNAANDYDPCSSSSAAAAPVPGPSALAPEEATARAVPPASGGHKSLAAVAALNPGRRRASVAVWSDPRLMAKVQAAQQSASTNGQGPLSVTTTPTSPSRFSRVMNGAADALPDYSNASIDFHPDRFMTAPSSRTGTSSVVENQMTPDPPTLEGAWQRPEIARRIARRLGMRAAAALRKSNEAFNDWFGTHVAIWAHEVDLSGCKKVGDDVLRLLAADCASYATVLKLKGCFAITDAGLGQFMMHATSLGHLDLHGCWEISPATFVNMSGTYLFPKLRTLDLSNLRKIDDASLRKCLLMFPNLVHLSLGYCKALTANMFGLEMGPAGSPVIESPKSAPAAIDTERIPFRGGGHGITQPSLMTPPLVLNEAAAHTTWHTVRQLQSLNLQRCTGIRDDAFAQWREIAASGTGAPFALRSLVLGDCSLITDKALVAIAATCPQLQVLGLAFCCALTDTGSAPSIAALPALKVLDMSFCGALVSSMAIGAIASGCTALSRIGMRGCYRADDALIEQLAGSAHALRVINMGQCKGVTASSRALAERTGWFVLETESVIEDAAVDAAMAKKRAGQSSASGSAATIAPIGRRAKSAAPARKTGGPGGIAGQLQGVGEVATTAPAPRRFAGSGQ